MRSSSLGSTTRARASAVPAPRPGTLASELALAGGLLAWLPVWLLLAAGLAGLVGAYQVPNTYEIDVGSPSDQAYVRNFHTRLEDTGRTYRWSDVYGYVLFPGLGGSRPFTATVELDPARPARVTLIVNGSPLFEGTLQPGWQEIALRVDQNHPQALDSRDTVLEIRAPDYRTPDLPSEPKGVKVATVRVEQATAGGLIVPPYTHLALLEGTVLLVYLLVGRALAGQASLRRSRLWGLTVAALCSLAMVTGLARSHIAVSAASSHFAITAASALLLLVVAERLAVRRRAGSAAQNRLLAVCVALGFVLRYGGAALPQSVIIDMPWHMKWLRTLLAGDWQSLYFPGGLSSVPREWGMELLIPKSPLFYVTAAPLGILPFDLETLVKWLICFIDTTLVVAVFWLALRMAGSRWAGVAAAGLYAVMPLAFRAFAYGVLPTIFAQWLAVGVFVALLALAERNWRLWHWPGFVLLLALALLAFPTVALFVSLVLPATAMAWWLAARRRGSREGFQWRVLAALAAAWVLSILAYYGLYVSPVLASASALLAPGAGGGSTVRWPGGFGDLLAWTADYVVSVLPALLGATGLALAFARRLTPGRSRAVWLVAAWLAIAPLFLAANYRVDMIGKHLFFTMAPVAVAGGLAVWTLARRGRWGGALAALALGAVAWQGLIFWIDRLVRAST
jgi:hypothetical protein